MKFHVIEKRACWVHFDHEVEANTLEDAEALVSLGESVSSGHQVMDACDMYDDEYETVLIGPTQDDLDSFPRYDVNLSHAENLKSQTAWQKQFNDCTVCHCRNNHVQCSACGWWGYCAPEGSVKSA